MNPDIIMTGIGLSILAVNCTTMILTFPGKRNLLFTVVALLLFTVVFYTGLYFAGAIVPDSGEIRGLVYLPVMILLFEGKLFHKVFAFFLQYLFTAFQIALAKAVSGFFAGFGFEVMFIVFLAVLTILLTTYVVLMIKVGRRLFKKIFIYGRSAEWAMYSFGSIFAFAVLTTTQIAQGSLWHTVMTLFFILWSFVILCFAIINANEKSRHKYEAEFARDIISSERDHYQKMNELHDELRTIRHDYKYHMDAISEMLNSDNKREAEKYLADIQEQFAESEMPNYCPNTVINPLLAGYSERCVKLNIKYIVEISIPTTMRIPNYEMCIVLGNLLENAVYACEQYEGARKIELVINTQGLNLAVMVKNSFSGETVQNDNQHVSVKKDGGLGLRSVQAVAARYGGELMTEWDETAFSAYVLMRL